MPDDALDATGAGDALEPLGAADALRPLGVPGDARDGLDAVDAVGPSDLDLVAAALRADAADADTFFAVLGGKLSGALGERVTLEREGGLFKKERPVRSIAVDVGTQRLSATRGRRGIECRVAHEVRGIVLSSDEVGLDTWLRLLAEALTEEAQRSAVARAALESLLT